MVFLHQKTFLKFELSTFQSSKTKTKQKPYCSKEKNKRRKRLAPLKAKSAQRYPPVN